MRVIFLLLSLVFASCTHNLNRFDSFPAINIGTVECLNDKKFVCMKSARELRSIFDHYSDIQDKTFGNYDVSITIQIKPMPLVTNSDDVTIRTKILLIMKYQLTDINENKKICAGTLKNRGSLDVANSPYTNLISQEFLTERIIKEAGGMLRARILRCLIDSDIIKPK